MKKKIYLSSRIYLINKRFNKNEYYHFFQEPNNVIFVPVIDKKFILVKQKREPINQENFEFPMGWIDKNETAIVAANRELYEETGFKSIVKPKKLITFFADPGRGNRICEAFYSKMLIKIKNPEKGIKIFFKSKFQIINMIKKRKFNNASHIAVFFCYLNKF